MNHASFYTASALLLALALAGCNGKLVLKPALASALTAPITGTSP